MPKIELAVLEWNGRGPRLLGRLGDPDLVASVQERLAARHEAATHAGALRRVTAPSATPRALRADRATAAGASSGPPSSSTRRVARRAR